MTTALAGSKLPALHRAIQHPLLSSYRAMLTARLIDQRERELVKVKEASFHVSGAGHEASAVLARHLAAGDYLHCHYRDKALMLARGIAPEEFFHALLCTARGASAGRQMSAHLCNRSLNLLSIVGPVGNSALQAAGIAAQVRDDPARPIVLCSLGDGMTQEGEVLEAIAHAVRCQLPVLFLIHENRYAISTLTRGRTFFSLPDGEAAEFYGIGLVRLDGRDAAACDKELAKVAAQVRRTRRPAIAILQVERLDDHTAADDQAVYRPAREIAAARRDADPVRILRDGLLKTALTESELQELEDHVRDQVDAAAGRALRAPAPQSPFSARRELPTQASAGAPEVIDTAGTGTLTMAQAIRQVLKARMQADPRVSLFGLDIEDPKGDIFRVTRGLSTAFPGRVHNAPLSESTIVGTCIGQALAGGRPVAFIQFADFLPIAYNQLASELGSMYWRTAGQWECPVILMVACGGYRPGLGPFHSQSLESIIAHIPGIDVCMASCAADAAGMLNAAFESGRPTVFFYPKAILHDRIAGKLASPEAQEFRVPVGKARVLRGGSDLTLVGWGNTVGLCEKAARLLAQASVQAEVIDLRWLSPWDREVVLTSANRTGRLIVVHEDNRTCGLGAEVAAEVAEHADRPIAIRRIARPDTYIPCNYANHLEVLPGVDDIVQAAARMLDLELVGLAPQAGVPATPRRITAPPPKITGVRKTVPSTAATSSPIRPVVGMSAPHGAVGSRRVSNEDLAARFSRTPDHIFARTGIQRRPQLDSGQTIVGLAAQAARAALAADGLTVADLDLVLCTTSTPHRICPSTACQVLQALSEDGPTREIPACDILAACSGYLYALGTAHDFLQSRPGARVLVVTAEALSTVVDPGDYDTAVLFGDAASATILHGASHLGGVRARLHRPALSAHPEDGSLLSVPPAGSGHIHMEGARIFPEAIRRMIEMLHAGCAQAGTTLGALDAIVPHQANGRIIDAIRRRLDSPRTIVVNEIAELANTSSSTIPLALSHHLARPGSGGRIGLCAFGGGFTFGGAVLEAQ